MTELNLRQRKASCNIELPSFLKKAGRKNSDQSGFITPNHREMMLNKKKSKGWSENVNFKFAEKTNSDNYSNEANHSPTTLSPISKNLRKHSDY